MDDEQVQIERFQFFSNAMLIKSLCSARAFERIEELRDHILSNTDVKKDHLALGYKLVVQFGIWGLLDHLVLYPEILDLRGDPHLRRWWKFIQGEDGTTLKAAINEPDTELARVACGIDDLVTLVLQAGVSWDKIAEVGERLDLLSDELLAIARDCSISILSDDQTALRHGRIFRTNSVKLLHDSWKEGVNSSAFRYCLRKPTEWKHMDLPGQSMFDIQTHRDNMSLFPEYDGAEFEPGWIVGKLSAVIVSLQETDQWSERLGDPFKLLRQNAIPDRAWEAGSRIFRHTPGSDLSGIEFGLACPPKLPVKILPSLSAQVSLADPVDRLKALLGRRPILIGSRDSRSTLHVETIVSGLACTLPNNRPLNILRIIHGPETNAFNSVSLAVLLPSYPTFGDSSEWWVFDRAHRTRGLNASNDERVIEINGIAERLGRQINWIDLHNVPVEKLLSFCDDRAFQRLRNQFDEQERINSELRGAFPELLSAQLLSQTGYHPVRSSFDITFPNGVGREIDAAGIRLTDSSGHCRIIEVKKRSATQHDLQRYIRRFDETIRLADANRPVLALLVGFSEPILSVSGLFISMAKNVDMSDMASQYGIEFWNFGRFVTELRKAGFHDRYINLLQDSLFVWKNDFRGS